MLTILLKVMFIVFMAALLETLIAYLLKYKSKGVLVVIASTSAVTSLILNLFLAIALYLELEWNYAFIVVLFEIVFIILKYKILSYLFKKRYPDYELFLLSLATNIGTFIISQLYFLIKDILFIGG